MSCLSRSAVKAGNGLRSWEELRLCKGWSAILWQKGSESAAVQIQGLARGSHPAQCHLTEKPVGSGLTSLQPKYSTAVFPTGDASRMEGESHRDMIRNGGLI